MWIQQNGAPPCCAHSTGKPELTAPDFFCDVCLEFSCKVRLRSHMMSPVILLAAKRFMLCHSTIKIDNYFVMIYIIENNLICEFCNKH